VNRDLDLSETYRISQRDAQSRNPAEYSEGQGKSVLLARKYDRLGVGESQTVDLIVRKKCKEERREGKGSIAVPGKEA
jgi:hypothetical protein